LEGVEVTGGIIATQTTTTTITTTITVIFDGLKGGKKEGREEKEGGLGEQLDGWGEGSGSSLVMK